MNTPQPPAATDEVGIRRATPADLPELGKLGALLMRAHHEFDARRFTAPGADPEVVYRSFLEAQFDDADSAIFVAVRDDAVVGYLYAGIEPPSFRELRARAGFIHDIFVAKGSRRSAVAKRLTAAAIEWLHGRAIDRVMLWTAPQNEPAQRLFADIGFRPTMIEMSRDVG